MVVVGGEPGACAAGLWAAAAPRADLLAFLISLTLGTVADVVPLKGLNRSFVTRGSWRWTARECGASPRSWTSPVGRPPEPGISVFAVRASMPATHRPRRVGVDIGWSRSDEAAQAGGRELDRPIRAPGDRGVGAGAGRAEALAATRLEERGAVVVHAPRGWHPRRGGLVAERIKERFGRPPRDRAGARWHRYRIGALDRRRRSRQRGESAVRERLLIKGGCHAMAAGVTLKRDALGRIPRLLEDRFAAAVAAAPPNGLPADRRGR